MCEACDLTRENPNSGRYNADCPGCKARAIAGSPQYAEAEQLGHMTPMYAALLRRTFGDDIKAAHAEVKVWRELMKEKA